MSTSIRQTATRALLTLGIACATVFVVGMQNVQAATPACPALQKYCPGAGGCIGEGDLCLLEPTPGGVSYIPASAASSMGAFFLYINQGIWAWAFGVAIGITVLNGTFAGFQIMLGNREAGKERFMWSTIGLLILLLSGTILAFINPAGFTSA
ncbi:MAG TPA: hypothetical protein PKV72_00410 [Candidatus Peribacteria bacterium]|nr:hypothetical protein [Candidatus Peribacteria bacterium]